MFDHFSDNAQIWVYGFKEELNVNNLAVVKNELDAFKQGWLYHGQPVLGDYTILENRFAVLVTNDLISGCSIDSSVAVFKKLKNEYMIDALDQNQVFYREHNSVKSIDRVGFQNLVDQGKIDSKTKVFNLMIAKLGELRNGKFELDFSSSWHSKVFRPKEVA